MKMGIMVENWAGFASTVAGIMLMAAIFQQYFPRDLRCLIALFLRYFLQRLWDLIKEYGYRLMKLMNMYTLIFFPNEESRGGHLSTNNEVYPTIEGYLSTHGDRLKADMTCCSPKLVLNPADHEEITDTFEGAKLRWSHLVTTVNNLKKRSFTLSFRNKHRELVLGRYIPHVIEKGKAVIRSNRQRRLYTNNPEGDGDHHWDCVPFEHPATFRTLAMDPQKKQQIQDDLTTFSSGKDYYAKIGKAWKRGYLLYGPSGTGKTTIIAAMSNLLNFDVYNLQLTSVKNNITLLQKLMIDTSPQSIIVIKDIDHSLDLNFIDALWSACGQERIIIFTTNHVERLDQAFICRARVDMCIEMSFCSFEAFKVLADNYLNVNEHPLFEKVRVLLQEIQIIPAEVADYLMPKAIRGDATTSLTDADTATTSLTSLIQALLATRDKEKELPASTMVTR